MGVEAEYLYGYMVEVENIEWDIDYLKSKYDIKEKLNNWSDDTYGDLIESLESNDIGDLDDLEVFGIKYCCTYDNSYLYFTHKDLAEKFPDRKLGELDILAREYAKQCGVKNVEVFTWKEFGYFD